MGKFVHGGGEGGEIVGGDSRGVDARYVRLVSECCFDRQTRRQERKSKGMIEQRLLDLSISV